MTVQVGIVVPDRKQLLARFSHAKAQSISLRKLAHAIYREFFSGVKKKKKKKISGVKKKKNAVYNIFAKTLIVGTH